MQSRYVLAIEPYFGGSHRGFLEGVTKHSRHRWRIVSGPAVHWKWRMRVAPLSLAGEACRAVDERSFPDALLCSDMLDLPAWLGLIQRLDPQRNWAGLPIALYFHENQFTYPRAPQARVDFHYGYSNLLSAIAATRCLFNSAFHQDSFLTASEAFVSRMPDCKAEHDFQSLREKSAVIPPGFDPPTETLPTVEQSADFIHLGWVSRWEHDKRPDRFYELLKVLQHHGVGFRLVLLGPRDEDCEALQLIRRQFAGQVVVDQFAESRHQYWQQLSRIDVVVSTADHEFFGIAVCEAIWAGAAPVLPDRLSYRELVGPECRYDSIEGAVALIESMADVARRRSAADQCRQAISHLKMSQTVPQLDEAIDQMAG